MSPIDSFSSEEQDRLYPLKKDIEIGDRTDFDHGCPATYAEMQTHPACRWKKPTSIHTVDVMVALLLADKNVRMCRERTDSHGDRIVQKPGWGGIAA